MQKHLQKLLLIVAMIVVPWVAQAQTPDPISTFPYTCDFEDSGDAALWVTLNGTQENGWYVGTAVNATPSGSYSLYVSNNSGTSNAYNVTSAAASYSWAYERFTFAAGSYNISFQWKCLGEIDGDPYDFFRVFIVPDATTLTAGALPSTTYTWSNQFMSDIPTGWIGINGTNTYFCNQSSFTTLNSEFTITTAGNYKLVFLWLNDDNVFNNPPAAIDDITISVNSCPRTSALMLDSVSPTSASFHWTELGTATSWIIEYDSVNFVPGTGSGNMVVATNTSYTLAGLDSGTRYYVYLRAYCGAGDTSESRSLSFLTPLSDNSLPFICNFDVVSDTTGWRFIQNGQTNQWFIGTATNNGGTRSMYISNNNGSSNAYNTSNVSFSYAYKEFTLAAGSYAISYDWKCYGEGNYDYVRVFLMPASHNLTAGQDPTGGTSAYSWSSAPLPSTFVSLMGDNIKLNLQSSWQNVFTEFMVPTSGDWRLVFAWANDASGGTTPPGAIDNIQFLRPTCGRPANMLFSNITPTSFDASWTETGSASEWAVALDSAGITIYTDVVYDTTVSFTGRAGNIPYTVRVAALCDGNDTSMWLSANFRTPCTYLDSLPYFYGFEDAGTGTSAAFPNCWTRLNNGSSYGYYPYVSSSSTYNHTTGGSKGLYWYNTTTTGTYGDYQVIVLPGVDTDYYPIRTLQVRFWAKSSSTSYYPVFYVGVMSNPNDINTFVYLDTINVGNSTNWQEFESMLGAYRGNGNFVAIRANRPSSSWYAYVDDITLEQMPPCPRTSELTQVDATLNSVTITWTEMGEATQWVLEYDTVDFVPGTGAGVTEYPTSMPYTISGLDSAHNYYIYLHADCGSDTSVNRFILASTLAASPATLPFYCDFECDGTCGWELLNGTQTNVWYIDSAVNNGGGKSLYISNDGGTSNAYSNGTISYAYAYRTIEFADSGEFAYTYDWRSQGESHYYDFTRVFLAPAGYQWEANNNPAGSTYNFATWTCPAGWIELTEQFGSPANLSQSSTWRTATGTFRINSPATYNLVFAWANDGSGGSNPPTAIDNVGIQQNTCPSPVNFDVTYMSGDTVIVTWSAGGSETMWLVGNDSVSDVVYDTSYTFDGLAANTLYNFYVRAICDASDTSLPSTVSARTACGAITHLPFFEDFESYPDGTSSYLPPDCGIPCWARLDNASSYHFGYIGSRSSWPSGGHSGTGFLYYYMPTTTGTYADWIITVLPPIDVNEHPMNTLQMSFWVKMNSASTSGDIVIGVMTNPNQDSTFVPVDTVHVAGSVYDMKQAYFINYAGTGQYIALKYTRNSSTTTYYFVDDILVEPIPDCPAVIHLSSDNPTPTTVDLTWEEIGTATSWIVEYVPTGYPDDSIQTAYAFDTSITLTGLRPNTEYSVTVTVDCGTEVGGSAVTTFRTACIFIDSLPFTYGFEDANTGSSTSAAFVPCWERLNNGGSNFGYPYVSSSSTYNHTPGGTKGLYWYNTTTTGSYGDYQIVVLPGVDTDIYPINTLQLSFWARSSSTSYSPSFQVGVMTDPSNASTFTQVGNVNVGTNTTFTEYTVPLGTYTGSGQYVALRALRPTSSWYAYVDDFTLEVMPTCPDVERLSVQATVSNARVRWSYDTLLGITPSNYIVSYGYAADSLVGATTLTTPNTSLILTGLTPDTMYTISVAVDCDGTPGAASVYNFNTQAFPCLQWDTAGSGGPIDTYLVGTPGTSSTNVMPTNGGYNYAYCNHLIRTSDINVTGPLTIGGIDFQFAGTSPMTSKTNCTIYMCHTTLTSCTDFANPADLVLVYEGPLNCSPTSDGWNHFDFNRGTFAYNGTSNMMVAIVDNSGSTDANATFYYENIGSAISHRVYRNDSPYSFADLGTVTASNSVWRTNMRLTTGGGSCSLLASCGAPNVIIDSLRSTTAYLSWIPGHTESSWNIEYRVLGTTSWTSAATGVTTTNYALTGLSPNTQYQVRVGTPCSDTTFYSTVAFRTECGLLTALPWNDDLEAYSTGSSTTGTAFIPCWHHLNNGTSYGGYPYVSSSTSYSHGGGSKGLYWYNTTTTGSYGDYQCVVLPGIDTTAITLNTIQLRFWAKPSSSSYVPVFKIGIMSDPNDITTFQGVDTVTLTSTNWTEIEVPFTSFAGTGCYPAIKADRPTSSWYAYVDDFHLELAPSCPASRNVHSTAATTTSITIDWTDYSTPYAWEVMYTGNGVTSTTVVSTHPATLTSLTPATAYQIRVRPICSATDTGRWSEPGTAFTSCDLIVPPYFQDFDAVTGTSYSTAGQLPPCWDGYSNGTSAAYMPHVTNGSTYSYSITGNPLTLTSGSATYGDTKFVRLPQFATPINTITMSYWFCTESSTNGTLTVGYMTGNNYTTDFVPVVSHAASSASYHSGNGPQPAGTGVYDTVSFENVPDSAQYIAFKWVYTTSYYSCCIDNIEVTSTGAFCRTPTITGISHTYENATATWTGDANAYEVNIKESVAPDFTAADIPVVGNSYTFYGLQPATSYTVRVRQDCSADSLGYSEWVLETVVTDSLPCLPPDSLTVTDMTNATATFDWVPFGYETMWEVHVWNTAGFDSTYTVSTHPVVLGGYTAGVTYTASVRPLCGSAHNIQGDWGDTVTFTAATCPDVTGLTASEVGASSLRLNWTANPAADSWIIEYGYTGFEQGTGTQATSSTPSYVVTGLQEETGYDFYVRAQCGTDWYSENWAYVSATTEYSGVICDAPTGVSAVVAGNAATVSWTPGEGDISYELEYGPHGFAHGNGITQSATSSPVTIPNLNYETQYDVYVRAFCEQNASSAWSVVTSFTTETQGSEDCDPVTNLTATEITENSAVISWTAGATGSEWEVVLTNASGATLSEARTNEQRYQLNGLTPGTSYIVKVRTVCGDDQYSDYVSTSFTTIAVGIDGVVEASCTIYPNPTNSATTISVSGVSGKVKIAVVDMNGRTVASEMLECSADCTKTMDVERLAQGAYFVRITGENVNMVKKLIVR